MNMLLDLPRSPRVNRLLKKKIIIKKLLIKIQITQMYLIRFMDYLKVYSKKKINNIIIIGLIVKKFLKIDFL